MKKIPLLLIILVSTSMTVLAQDSSQNAAIKKTLNDFKTAIITNDTETASQLLHDEVVILEGQGSETKEQYLSHHFHSDGRFLSAIERKQLSQKIKTEGNIAWVTSLTKMTGTYNDREIDRTSLELAVLKRENGKWMIVAVHWS
ncbi:YybH family protein [Gracilimonas sediminicola]|uniref:Nuclear transport factor 2 family protein n=1 Tax=Gracilimonas sediminicola TaxID=2952158 RepID=A0A9X2L1J4_9BACT|nr:nuclear transport factor 2 family protein [Gracilimonas sediminicola]MCP9290555.1 nuclear transport factor 2 family protein [Gracilimonas sediminicola]